MKFAETPNRDQIVHYFETRFQQFGDSAKALDWNSQETQEVRYEIMLEMIRPLAARQKLTLLDVGCGLGHFLGYLERAAKEVPLHLDYYGIDLSPQLIAEAKKKYPQGAFEIGDFLEMNFRRPFDLVVASGLFNLNLYGEIDPLWYVQAALTKLVATARLALAVNFQSVCGIEDLGGPFQVDTKRYHFYHPDELTGIVKRLTHHFMLRHDYLSHDFSLYLYH